MQLNFLKTGKKNFYSGFLALVACFLLFAGNSYAQAPPNDDCANAINIPISGNGTNTGTFQSSKTNLTHATKQVGESFASLQFYSGTDKKSVWYKFYIPEHRSITVQLVQKDSAIAEDAVGITIYKSTDCPPNQGEVSTELAPISKFGSTSNTCVDPGEYYIQVSSKITANDSIWIALTVNTTTNTPYDSRKNAYDMGVIQGYGQLNYNFGCLSIDTATEICPALGKNDSDYNQTLWVVFKTPPLSEMLGFSFVAYDYSTNPSDTQKIGYNLYKGDARTKSYSLFSGCNVLKAPYKNFQYLFPDTVRKCDVQPNQTYTMQIFGDKNAKYNLILTISAQGKDSSKAANPGNLGSYYQLGDLSIRGSAIDSDYFACNSYMSMYPCGTAMPGNLIDTIPLNNYKFAIDTLNISTWLTFKISKAGRVTFGTKVIDCMNFDDGGNTSMYLGRLFAGDITKNCNLPLVTQWRNLYSNIICLNPGTYSYQIVGKADRGNISTSDCYNIDLGKLVITSINFDAKATQYSAQFDNYHSPENLGDITSQLKKGNVYTVKDYFGNKNTTDTIAGAVNKYINRALYREFYIGTPMQIELQNLDMSPEYTNYDNTLYSGKATDDPAKLKAIPAVEQDQDYRHYEEDSTFFRSSCMDLTPGWYTIVDLYDMSCDDRAVSNQIRIRQLKLCPANYNRPYKACNVNAGKPLVYGTSGPDYGVLYHFPEACFDCTIDSPFINNLRPCLLNPRLKQNPYNRTAYYVFTTSAEAYVNILTNDDENYGGLDNNFWLYKGDVRKDSSYIGDTTNRIKPCGKTGDFCRLQPGTYTLVTFANKITSTNPTLYIDKVVNSKFDFASKADNLGFIAVGNTKTSASDVVGCTTGAYVGDGGMTEYVPNVYYGKPPSTVPYPMTPDFNYYTLDDSVGYDPEEQPVRNLWYTFTTFGTGTVDINVYPDMPTKSSSGQGVFPSIFRSAHLNQTGDSTLAQGLQSLPITEYGQNKFSFTKTDCDSARYYILANYSAQNENFYLNYGFHMSVSVNGQINGQQGDYCSNAINASFTNPSLMSGTATVNCHTTGESFGEDGSDMACLTDGTPYKTTWYKFTNTRAGKTDISFNLVNNTNASSDQIRYRVLFGSCDAMTPGPCEESANSSFTLDCMTAGDYYIQVAEPISATGTITVNETIANAAYPSCKPISLFQPLANFTSTGGCNGSAVSFINLSSAGDAIKYFWDFGNGQTGSDKSPVIKYANHKLIDTFNVFLRVTDTVHNAMDSITLPVYVFRDPITISLNKPGPVSCGTKLQLSAKCNYADAIYTWQPAGILDNPYIADPVATMQTDTTFIVSASIENCVLYDTFRVKINRKLNVSVIAGNCSKQSAILSANTGFDNYQWYDGTNYYNGREITVNHNGQYWVHAANDSGCTAADTLNIVLSAIHATGLPKDTTLCSGSTITLSGTLSGTSYLWSTGDTTPSITVNKGGLFWLQVHVGSCSVIDTVNVHFINLSFSLGNDTTICPGDTFSLDAHNTGAIYLWNTGETSEKILVSKTGTYSVYVTKNNCTATGSKQVKTINFPPIHIGAGDTSFCEGETGTIGVSVPVPAKYKWSSGDTTAYITVSESGIYSINVHIGSCDTTLVKKVNVVPFPTPFLGDDTMICFRFTKLLDAGAGDLYSWFPGGESSRLLQVSHGGIYAVKVTNEPGCIKTDTIVIDTVCDQATLYVPNSFTPDGNGLNDFFMAVGTHVTAFNMQVYNRWGELLFESDDMSKGWDGKFKNKICPSDVYLWIIKYSAYESPQIKSGTVTLLR